MRTLRVTLFSILALVSVYSAALGQAVKGSLLGAITDSSGAAAANATVTITETRTNITSATTTNSDGNYVFSNIVDGLYRVEASLSGFKKIVRENIEVKVNTTIRVDLALEVGNVNETVSITAEAALLQTDRADTGRLLESRQVAELPLGFNRNFQSLLVTVPGATRPSRPHSEFFNPQDSLESKVNGQSRLSNNFQIEGVDDNHRTGLLTILIPAADAIESVSISTSNFDAEFGRAGGAVSNVTLKSGTNDIHGSVFFFGNNENTRAKPYFSSQTPNFQNPFTRYRQYGFTLGGPIVKNKLFYFGDYQRTIDKLGKANFHNIPIVAWRAGDFRSAATKIYDPATGSAAGFDRQQISCNGALNVICPNRISPIAAKLLGFLPGPSIPSAALGQNNLSVNTTREKTIHSFDVKLNYQLNDSNLITGRLSFQRPQIFDPGSFGIYGGPANGGFAGTGTQDTYSTQGTWTHTFNPRLLMDVRVGVNYYHNVAVSQAAGLKTSDEVGIKNANTDDFSDGLTQIDITGFSNPVLGFSASLPWDRGETTTNITTIVTKLFGNHTLKVGGEWRRNRDLLLQIQDNGGVRGRFSFNGARTGLAGLTGVNNSVDNAANSGLANSLASFLLDLPSGVSRDIKVIDNPGTRHWAFFTFINDKWQVTQKLTLDLGLRHEYYRPFTGLAEKGGLSNYDPATNTARVAGIGDVPDDLGVTATWKNFAPRLGAAYRFSDKTVVRAGFGTTIIPFPNNSYAFNFPVKQNNQFNAPNGFASVGSMAVGFPAPIIFDIPASGIVDANLPILRNSGLFAVPIDLREGKIHSWNAVFQREIWWGITAEAAYVGNVGRGVITPVDINASTNPEAARPPSGSATPNDNAGRPLFQKFGRSASVTSWIPTDSNYHSLQVKADRRFTKGLLLTTSYTYSRAINFSDDNDGLSTPANPELAWGRANFDRTHMFSQTFVWELPIGRKGNGFVRAVLGGWQLTGLLVAQTGTPIGFTTSGTTLHAPGNTQRPNASGRPKVLGNIGPGELYFDPSVFSQPVADAQGFAPFGNMKRNDSINGPGYVNLDGSIFKRFRFTERFSGELRADVFNVTNSPHFNNPNGGYVAPPAGSTFPFPGNNFGQVTGAFGERLVRFGARITF